MAADLILLVQAAAQILVVEVVAEVLALLLDKTKMVATADLA